MEFLEGRQMLSAVYRTYDGTGNNLAHPTWGSAGVDLLRQSPVEYADKISALARPNDPSPRLISNVVVAQCEPTTNDRLMSDFAYVWGQFVDHDLDLTPNGTTEEADIPVPKGDPYFDPAGTGTQVIQFFRSIYDPATGTAVKNPRQQVNVITAYMDGSQVYGSDPVRANALRTHVGGRLLTSDGFTNGVGDLLPLNKFLVPVTPDNPLGQLPNANDAHIVPDDQLFVAGDVRVNENIELTAIQTIMMREHNRKADEIAAQNPGLSDEQIYQKARQWVIAEIQSITYNEWIPMLCGKNALHAYGGYDSCVNAGVSNEFSTAAFRLHTLIGNDVSFVNNDGEVVKEVPLSDAFSNPNLIKDTPYAVDYILKGRASDNSEEVDTMIVNSLRNFLFGPPGSGGLDLASLNLQRARDHGIADYNTLRTSYGLKRVTSFAQITSDPVLQAKLKSLYGNVNNIDPWVGMLAEDHVPGSSTGPLCQKIVLDQFDRTRDGDRYWYERIFSGRQLAELENTRLSDIIRRNTVITNLQNNVFFFKVSIGGTVFNDTNCRCGCYEQGLGGWTVQLLDESGNVLMTTVTKGDGSYNFTGLTLGTYIVREVMQPGWKRTTPNPDDIVITRGIIINNVDFGNKKVYSPRTTTAFNGGPVIAQSDLSEAPPVSPAAAQSNPDASAENAETAVEVLGSVDADVLH